MRTENLENGRYVTLDDSTLLNAWKCTSCGSVVECFPVDYAEHGTPVCEECCEDMAFVESRLYHDPQIYIPRH